MIIFAPVKIYCLIFDVHETITFSRISEMLEGIIFYKKVTVINVFFKIK
jgi:hypothetical protein